LLKKSINGKETKDFIIFKLMISKPTKESKVQWFCEIINFDTNKIIKATCISSMISSSLDIGYKDLIREIKWEPGKRITGLLTIFGGEVSFEANKEDNKWLLKGFGSIKSCKSCKEEELIVWSVDNVELKYKKIEIY